MIPKVMDTGYLFSSSCPSHLEGILLDIQAWEGISIFGLLVVIWTVTEWLIYIGSGSIILENSSISPSQWEYAQTHQISQNHLDPPNKKQPTKGCW